jgi:hypothetical protein
MAGERFTQLVGTRGPGREYGSFASRIPSRSVARYTQLVGRLGPGRRYGSFARVDLGGGRTIATYTQLCGALGPGRRYGGFAREIPPVTVQQVRGRRRKPSFDTPDKTPRTVPRVYAYAGIGGLVFDGEAAVTYWPSQALRHDRAEEEELVLLGVL